MTNRVQSFRAAVTNQIPAPNTRQPGELWLNFPDFELGFIDALKTAQKLIAVRFFQTTATYGLNDMVVYTGNIWVANGLVAPGPFLPAQWTQVTGAVGGGGGGGGGPFLPLAGGAMLGSLILAHDPTASLESATKHYVDLLTGVLGGGSNGPFLPLAGGTMLGDLVLNRNPVLALGAATKAYVDSAVSGGGPGGGPYLPLAGGTMTGPIVLAADPAAASQAANKHYVDTAIAGISGGGGGGGAFLPGMMIDYAGLTAPSGWLLCDGGAYLSTDPLYAALFGVIGTTFGSAPGGYFKVPDLRDRAAVGQGVSYSLGATGGAKTVTLSVANLATHTHVSGGHVHSAYQDPHHHNITANDPGTGDPIAGVIQATTSPGVGVGSPGPSYVLLSDMTTDTQTPTVTVLTGYDTINNTGSSSPHENMPPFFAATKIIKL